MNNPLYLTYASPWTLNHGTNGMLPAQLLLASYTAGSKLRITSGRLQEPAASYNKLINDQPVVDKAVAVFLVFYIISTADSTKLTEAEIRLDNDTAAQHRLTGEALEDRISNYTRAQMKGACLEACVVLVVSTYLVQFGFSDLAVGCVALLAISQLVSVETHELSYFQHVHDLRSSKRIRVDTVQRIPNRERL